MKNITIATANFTFIALLGFVPPIEKIEEVLPLIQASAFTAMAVNNGIQIAERLKDAKPH